MKDNKNGLDGEWSIGSLEGAPEKVDGELKVDKIDSLHIPTPLEREIRKNNPDMTDDEIWIEMYNKTKDETFLDKLSDDLKDIFLF